MSCGFLVVDAGQVLPESPIVITSQPQPRAPKEASLCQLALSDADTDYPERYDINDRSAYKAGDHERGATERGRRSRRGRSN